METITLRVDEETLQEIDDEAEEEDQNRSEYLRDVLDARTEHEQEIRNLQIEKARLERKVRKLIEMRDEHEDLAEYAEQHRTILERKHRASVVQRVRWWLLGTDDD